ncbi:hypothetical protein FRACYDRAFT_142382, partial [Fragilariopsis cylindrus CCMP1102]
LKEKAAELRREVNDYEEIKNLKRKKMEEINQELQNQKDDLRLRYSVEIPILKGDGIEVMERCDFTPRIKQQQQKMAAIQAPLPLGIILGQDIVANTGGGGLITTVDDLAVDGNGSVIGGIQVGDIVRGCTACQSTMEQPTWQLILGGVGQPKTTRMMFSCDNQPLEEILTAISSNTMDPQQRYVWLVLER